MACQVMLGSTEPHFGLLRDKGSPIRRVAPFLLLAPAFSLPRRCSSYIRLLPQAMSSVACRAFSICICVPVYLWRVCLLQTGALCRARDPGLSPPRTETYARDGIVTTDYIDTSTEEEPAENLFVASNYSL